MRRMSGGMPRTLFDSMVMSITSRIPSRRGRRAGRVVERRAPRPAAASRTSGRGRPARARSRASSTSRGPCAATGTTTRTAPAACAGCGSRSADASSASMAAAPIDTSRPCWRTCRWRVAADDEVAVALLESARRPRSWRRSRRRSRCSASVRPTRIAARVRVGRVADEDDRPPRAALPVRVTRLAREPACTRRAAPGLGLPVVAVMRRGEAALAPGQPFGLGELT